MSAIALWMRSLCQGVPLFPVPQTSQIKMASLSPDDPSRRLPQSVQKTSDPMAAMSLAINSPEKALIRNEVVNNEYVKGIWI